MTGYRSQTTGKVALEYGNIKTEDMRLSTYQVCNNGSIAMLDCKTQSTVDLETQQEYKMLRLRFIFFQVSLKIDYHWGLAYKPGEDIRVKLSVVSVPCWERR